VFYLFIEDEEKKGSLKKRRPISIQHTNSYQIFTHYLAVKQDTDRMRGKEQTLRKGKKKKKL